MDASLLRWSFRALKQDQVKHILPGSGCSGFGIPGIAPEAVGTSLLAQAVLSALTCFKHPAYRFKLTLIRHFAWAELARDEREALPASEFVPSAVSSHGPRTLGVVFHNRTDVAKCRCSSTTCLHCATGIVQGVRSFGGADDLLVLTTKVGALAWHVVA